MTLELKELRSLLQMSLLTSEIMKTLVWRVLERAESEGGEGWLERCLAGIEVTTTEDSFEEIPEETTAILEEGEVVLPCEPPPAPVPSFQTSRSQRNRPPERPSTSVASREMVESRSEEEEEDGIRTNAAPGRSQRSVRQPHHLQSALKEGGAGLNNPRLGEGTSLYLFRCQNRMFPGRQHHILPGWISWIM